jgi:hypothetical protein
MTKDTTTISLPSSTHVFRPSLELKSLAEETRDGYSTKLEAVLISDAEDSLPLWQIV